MTGLGGELERREEAGGVVVQRLGDGALRAPEDGVLAVPREHGVRTWGPGDVADLPLHPLHPVDRAQRNPLSVDEAGNPR